MLHWIMSIKSTRIIKQHNQQEKESSDGTVYVEIVKGMYGLPHAGSIAQELLEKRLAIRGYPQSLLIALVLWSHI